ncbi:hypothetical protein FACS1894187_13700 [Synergistales bacterium]|nr:hypothetical protein FACS1894187_13700 [Synergistales bacterium]
MSANKPLMSAYYLKEELRRIWEQPDRASAEKVFDNWITTAKASEVEMLKNSRRH